MRSLAAAISAAAIFFAAGHALAEPVSKYSDIDLDNCPKGQKFEDEPAYEVICPGPDGWELRVLEGDLRFWVEPRPAGSSTDIRFETLSPFNTINTKAEWRGETEGGTFKPYAMILRYFTDDGIGDPASRGNVLVVTKVPRDASEQSCHVAYVNTRAVSNANAVAAHAADTMARDFDCGLHQPVTVMPGEPANMQPR
ncbi:hypothetical protein [Pyruvatibacter mobilis]|uniref:hypothetical protein n=1 Tax=Pyruvatibacter mobilis TaxID=1712261 RepID=UPI003BAC8ACD